jgi:probable HAF family extracellular repeat protein
MRFPSFRACSPSRAFRYFPRLETLENRCLLTATYDVMDIGALQSGRDYYSVSFDLTDDLTVVGGSDDITGPPPFAIHEVPVEGQPGQLHRLDILSPWGGQAFAINAAGTAVGVVIPPGRFTEHAARWKPQGEVTDLGLLPGGDDSPARDINAEGDVVGTSTIGQGLNTHAFLYPAGGTAMKDLGTLDGGSSSAAYAINNKGQVVGVANTADPQVFRLAFLYSDGTMSSLGSFDGQHSEAHDVNDNGIAVGLGFVGNPLGPFHAARFQLGTTPLDLGTLSGGTFSSAEGINNLGQIVGYSYTTQFGGTHAFLWTDATGMLDLNDLLPANSGWILGDATAIDDHGDITGWGVNPQGNTSGFILVPEERSIRALSASLVSIPSGVPVAEPTAPIPPGPATLALPFAEPGGVTAHGDTLHGAAPAANGDAGTKPVAAGTLVPDDTGDLAIRGRRLIGTPGDGTEADVVLGIADELTPSAASWTRRSTTRSA